MQVPEFGSSVNPIPTKVDLLQAGGLGAVFGQTVNPISTRGADYAHHSTTSPLGFLDLATALRRIFRN